MTRRSLYVACIAIGIAIGAWWMARYTPAEGTAIGQLLPDVRVQHLATGDSVGLRTAYEGHVTLVNLWATYCIPCRKEMPSMERIYQDYRDRGFRIAAVSLDDGDTEPVLAFARELELSFEILQDRSNLSLQVLQGMGLPFSVLIDTRGRVRFVALGAEEWDTAEHRARIEALLPPLP